MIKLMELGFPVNASHKLKVKPDNVQMALQRGAFVYAVDVGKVGSANGREAVDVVAHVVILFGVGVTWHDGRCYNHMFTKNMADRARELLAHGNQ